MLGPLIARRWLIEYIAEQEEKKKQLQEGTRALQCVNNFPHLLQFND
jgi:hypothetical protein